jgi:predicted transcriptional regulator
MDPSSLLGPLEGEVMKVMWLRKEATVREVVDSLRSGRSLAYTTVMTIMNNLLRKGLLRRVPRGRAYLYQVALAPDELLAKASKEAVGEVLARFGDLAVARFLEAVGHLGPEDLERLRRAAGLDDQSSSTKGDKP